MKKLLLILLLPLVCLADTGGNLDLHNGASLGSNPGRSLTLYTSADGDSIVLKPADRKVLSVASATSQSHSLVLGDSGVSSAQTYNILTSTADGADTSVVNIGPGAAIDTARGPYISLGANEASVNEASVQINSGDDANARLQLKLNHVGAFVQVLNSSNGVMFGVAHDGSTTIDGPLSMAGAVSGADPLITGLAAIPADIATAISATGTLNFTNGSAINASFIRGVNSTAGASLGLFKSRATDGSADTIVQSGDTLGRLDFYGANGTTYDIAAQIKVTSDGTPGGTTDMPGAIDFLVSPDGSATLASALKISNNKNITFGGTLIGTGTTTIGWTIQSGANTACSTTCTTPCVFGWDTSGTQADIVDCSGATADECLCAGAS